MISSRLNNFIVASLAALAMTASGCGDDGNGNGDGDGGNGNGDGGNGDGGNNTSGCKKIDLVFSVDPSMSMADELRAMSSDVFPKFATALRTVGGGLEDYRVGVIDACPQPANYHTRGASINDCAYQSGQAWIDSSSTALEAEFSCAGDIYLGDMNCPQDNQDEQPIAAAVAALTAPFAGNQNAGFLRDDALLVVITITDEDECPDYPGCTNTSDAKASELYDSLVAVKGDVKKMVYLGIGGATNCINGTYGKADRAVLTNKVSSLFVAQSRGVSWDLCTGRLEDGLTAAMAVIESACDEFSPID